MDQSFTWKIQEMTDHIPFELPTRIEKIYSEEIIIMYVMTVMPDSNVDGILELASA